MAEDMVLTPGGFRPRSRVHLIEPGHVLDGTGGRLRKLDPSGQLVADFGPILPRSGDEPLMPRNATVMPKEEPSGLIAYAFWNNDTGNPISSFTTKWVVPPPPTTQSGQTIFLSNGIQTSTIIYEYILQWGHSVAGGGNYWGTTTWYSTAQAVVVGQVSRVNPGDIVLGMVGLTGLGQFSGTFNYNCRFQGIANSDLPIQNVPELTQCVETLTAQGITQCSDYPAKDAAVCWDISIQTGSVSPMLNWTPVNSVTDCGQHVVVVSNSNPRGVVVIYYRQAGSLSLRQFLVTHGANPNQGIRAFIQGHYPSISSLRALLEL